MLLRARERGDEQIRSSGTPTPVSGGRRGPDGAAAGDGGLEVGDQVRDGSSVAGEVPLHQGLVLALPDDPLDQLAAEPIGVRGVDAGFEKRISLDRAVPAAVEQVGTTTSSWRWQSRTASSRPARPVQLGDDDRPRHADGCALRPELLGGGVHPVDGRDDEQVAPRAARREHHGVRRAGGVQECDPVVLVLDGGHPEGDRPLLADLHLLGVQTGGALLDAAGPRQGAGRDEQGLGQGGLPRARVADERHGTLSAERGPERSRCPSP